MAKKKKLEAKVVNTKPVFRVTFDDYVAEYDNLPNHLRKVIKKHIDKRGLSARTKEEWADYVDKWTSSPMAEIRF